MRNMSNEQELLLSQLRAADPALIVDWDETRGVARSVRGKLLTSETERPELALEKFLDRFGPLFGPADLNHHITSLRRRQDRLGFTHLEYQQYETGVDGSAPQTKRFEVYGSKLIAHFDKQGQLIEVQSSCWRNVNFEPEPRLTVGDVRLSLQHTAETVPGYREIARAMRDDKSFPVAQEPHLVAYPKEGSFRLGWTTFAYGPVTDRDAEGKLQGPAKLKQGLVVIDAINGEQMLFAPTVMNSETPDAGSGQAVTPLGGPYTARSLNVVHVDTGTTYSLKDETHNREIVTYDAGGNSSWVYPSLASQLNNGTVPVSQDTDGDHNWNLSTNTTDAQHLASQQPEVDTHYFLHDIYGWYNAISGGRDGWDDGQYSTTLVPHLAIRAVSHAYDGDASTVRSVNAYQSRQMVNGKWFSYLAFFDGDGTHYDYMPGCNFIVAHEYQHAITDFSFIDGSGNPGLPYVLYGWYGAVHEGLSDVFGGLYSEDWMSAREISPTGMIFRNLAFPRDTNSYCNSHLNNHNYDHFDDRNLSSFAYNRGTIIAHCAYLMGQGGVHQRASRSPVLIPVYSMGREMASGRDILKASRIWYRALAHYFGNIGTSTGLPTADESTFRSIRSGCLSAASDLYGNTSQEYKTTRLAFYAVGLQPADEAYGPDLTFLQWGASWWMSRPYAGINSPDWSSVDLFINNGGASEWNALINVTDSNGNATKFENNIYCRIRNVGDQDAANVEIQFFYAKAGTSVVTWLPVLDKNGVAQKLNLASLAAGTANFPDSDQNTPPASACVKWCIPPLASGESVDHFCLRAVATATNDVNPYNNDVQSNIAYAAYNPAGFAMAFTIGNPTRETIRVDLHLEPHVPRSWKARIRESISEAQLRPGAEATVHLDLVMPPGADHMMEPPFDGDVKGRLWGGLSGDFTGILSEARWDARRELLRGQMAGVIDEVGEFSGRFEGRLHLETGRLKGRLIGQSRMVDGSRGPTAFGIDGWLRPQRRINIKQLVRNHPIGGITLQVQVPIREGPFRNIPPTETHVKL